MMPADKRTKRFFFFAGSCLVLLFAIGTTHCAGAYAGAGLAAQEDPAADSIEEFAASVALVNLLGPTGAAGSGITTRSVFITNNTYQGLLDNTIYGANGSGIDEADYFCNNDSAKPNSLNYAALMSDGGVRVATVNANCSGGCLGQVNWPLRSNSTYLLPDGRTLFQTDATLSIFTAVQTQASTIPLKKVWTGLIADWTTATPDCVQWTTNASGASGQVGLATQTDIALISSSQLTCDSFASLLCVSY